MLSSAQYEQRHDTCLTFPPTNCWHECYATYKSLVDYFRSIGPDPRSANTRALCFGLQFACLQTARLRVFAARFVAFDVSRCRRLLSSMRPVSLASISHAIFVSLQSLVSRSETKRRTQTLNLSFDCSAFGVLSVSDREHIDGARELACPEYSRHVG